MNKTDVNEEHMMSETFSWNDSLRLSNNKTDLAEKLLQMLEDELPSFQKELHQTLQNNDIKKLTDAIHKLHGSCCYTGVPKLRELTSDFESRLKANKLDQLESRVSQIIFEIDQVLKQLKSRKIDT